MRLTDRILEERKIIKQMNPMPPNLMVISQQGIEKLIKEGRYMRNANLNSKTDKKQYFAGMKVIEVVGLMAEEFYLYTERIYEKEKK